MLALTSGIRQMRFILVLENFREKILQPLQVLDNISNYILIERNYREANNARLLSHFS